MFALLNVCDILILWKNLSNFIFVYNSRRKKRVFLVGIGRIEKKNELLLCVLYCLHTSFFPFSFLQTFSFSSPIFSAFRWNLKTRYNFQRKIIEIVWNELSVSWKKKKKKQLMMKQRAQKFTFKQWHRDFRQHRWSVRSCKRSLQESEAKRELFHFVFINKKVIQLSWKENDERTFCFMLFGSFSHGVKE